MPGQSFPRLQIGRKHVTLRMRATRPSILDSRIQGDPWVVAHGNHTAGVYFGACQFLQLPAVPLDAMALNTQLFALRHRLPRRSA
jgi:hypothetical protein